MIRKIAVLWFASVLWGNSFLAIATDETNGSAAPPSTLPGINQSGSSLSNEEKASKKGEEASGSNSGAQSHETEKDAATSSDSEDIEKKSEQ